MTTDDKQSFVEHLDELRSRIIRSLVAGLIGLVIGLALYDPWILNILRGPIDGFSPASSNPFALAGPIMAKLIEAAGGPGAIQLKLHFIAPLEPFAVKLRASFFAGLILSFPYIAYQVWAFVSAGLKPTEKNAIRMYLPASLGLFVAGVLLAYFILCPVAVYFLVVVMGKGLIPNLVITKYVSLVVVCCTGFGMVFQLPIVILLLTRLGLVTPDTLREKRKYAILMMFVVGAMLTPPDVITQLLMATPMIVLYEISIWISQIAWKRRQKSLAG